MKKRTPFSQNGSDWMLECSRCIPASLPQQRRLRYRSLPELHGRLLRPFPPHDGFHRFRSSDRQAEETQRAPRRLCSPFPAQKQTPASCKMQWSCRDHCWDANVRHTGQNLRKAHTFVSSAIFTTALTMLALSEMLLSMAFWMSSKSKMLVTMPFRLICRKQRHQSPWGKCGDNGTRS